MSKLDELIRELCPDGVEYKRIGDFAMCFPGATPKTTHPEYWENGTIPWMSSGEVNQEEVTFTEKKITQKGYDATSTKMVPANTVVIALAGQGKTRGSVAITRISLCTNQSLCAIVTDETVLSEYLFHYMRSQYLKLRDLSAGNGTRGGLNMKMIESYLVPVPPVEIQSEIVGILNGFTNLLMELNAELTARKTQYAYYRDKLLTFNIPIKWEPMEEEFPFIRNGFVGTVTPYFTSEEQGVRYLEGTNIHDGVISDNEILYVSKEFHQKHIRNELKNGDILMVQSGHVGECAVVDDKYAGANCHALIIMSNAGHCNSRFVMHYLRSTEGKAKLKKITTGGTVKHILASNMKKFMIPVPPLDVQSRIVNVLDNFEKICSDLNIGLPAEIEARQKQYEYYRDKLLTFKEVAAT